MNLESDLIGLLRDKVNSNSDFVYNQYHNSNNKNQWSIICSCMDWISVATRFLVNKTSYDDDIDIRVMDIFSVISSVDIIVESVCQLHRVFFNTVSIPFLNEKDIFVDNQLNIPDYEYFKELRAMFGAHPVNLKHRDNKKWYASWPHDKYLSKDNFFEIRLYSNEIGIKDISFGINLNEVERYVNKYYSYIRVLCLEIDTQFKTYCSKYCHLKISESDNDLEQLVIIREEATIRFNSDYYKSTIDELIRIFSVNISDDKLAEEERKYKNELRKVIAEITNNLQNMKLSDLETDKILNPEYPYDKLGYSVSKLYAYNFDERREPLFDMHMNIFDDYSKGKYDFINTKNKEEIFLKMKLMLYSIK